MRGPKARWECTVERIDIKASKALQGFLNAGNTDVEKEMHLGGHMIVLTLQEMSSRSIIHPDSFCLVLNPHFLHLGHEPIPQVGILGIMGKR